MSSMKYSYDEIAKTTHSKKYYGNALYSACVARNLLGQEFSFLLKIFILLALVSVWPLINPSFFFINQQCWISKQKSQVENSKLNIQCMRCAFRNLSLWTQICHRSLCIHPKYKPASQSFLYKIRRKQIASTGSSSYSPDSIRWRQSSDSKTGATKLPVTSAQPN